MSKWTHVSGVIRIDTMPHIGDVNMMEILKEKFGNTSIDVKDKFSTTSIVEICTVPKGSESSIQYKIFKTGDESSLSWGLITIWGDLRDYDDPQEIFKWIRTACHSEAFWIRSCCIEINVNYSKQYIVRRDKTDELVMTEIFDE